MAASRLLKRVMALPYFGASPFCRHSGRVAGQVSPGAGPASSGSRAARRAFRRLLQTCLPQAPALAIRAFLFLWRQGSTLMATYNLLLLPGDGIGPEVMAEVKKLIAWMNAHRMGTFN